MVKKVVKKFKITKIVHFCHLEGFVTSTVCYNVNLNEEGESHKYYASCLSTKIGNTNLLYKLE